MKLTLEEKLNKYIDLAVTNGYKEYKDINIITIDYSPANKYRGIYVEYTWLISGDKLRTSYLDIITSEEFIVAIAKAIRKKLNITEKLDENYKKINIKKFNSQDKYIYLEKNGWSIFNWIYPNDEEKIISVLRLKLIEAQAKAIAEGKINRFISHILDLN